MKEYYDTYWSPTAWPEGVPRGRFPWELRKILERHVRPDARVLDAGCGDGANYGAWLAARCGSYTGVDISEAAVAEARKRGLNAKTVPDLASLSFPDAHFDVVVSVEVLEHLIFPHQAAREILRVLKPGGTFIATVPNTAYWRRRLDYALLGRWHPGGHPDGAVYPWRDPHLRFFTRKTLQRMLSEVGFQVVRVTGLNGSLFGDLPFVARRFGTDQISRPFKALETVLPSLFGANLVAIAERPKE